MNPAKPDLSHEHATVSSPVAAKSTPSAKPWDARLAHRLADAVKDTWLTPNFFTTLRLLTGLSAAVALATGDYAGKNVGALLFVASQFLDHVDGELARISGKMSYWGHLYDLVCDAAVIMFLFVGVGWGLTSGSLGAKALPMGIAAGVSVALIFQLRQAIESRLGKAGTRQPQFGGFEIEDILYLLPLVTIGGGLEGFLIAASLGAPSFAAWVIWEYRRVMR
jgi:phosphatidylglycerophosphate synthase